jgi:cobalamin-dependent methionine synthase I
VMSRRPKTVGERMNNSFARARKAFLNRDLKAYQQLARLEAERGAAWLDLNLDGTQRLQVRREEMLAFLPDVIPAIQEATGTPLCFDNPWWEYQKVALEHYDPSRSGLPIMNSIAASREHLEAMIDLVKQYDTMVVVMASEQFVPGGSAQCMHPEDAHRTAREFVERLTVEANRRPDQILIDPGLAPVGADTYGLVNIGLDAMRLISADPDLRGVHMIVGLSNFAWGTPRGVREDLENAYLTLGCEVGLDFAIANPEKNPAPLAPDHPMVAKLREALAQGRPAGGETVETSGFRQIEAIMAICSEGQPVDV